MKLGHNVKVGYFSQEQDYSKEENLTILESFEKIANEDVIDQLRSILGAFAFRGSDVYKKIKVLSGGEKSRLSLAKLLLDSYNLLI